MDTCIIWDRDLLQARFEEAGRTLLALPGARGVQRLGSSMPTVVRAVNEAYGWDARRIKPPAPSPAAISRMDEAFPWIGLIPAAPARAGSGELHSPHGGVLLRQIVWARLFMDPVSLKYLYSWSKIARSIGADHKGVQRWHSMALGLIVGELNKQAACRAA